MPPIKYNPIPFEEIDYIAIINQEIERGGYISSLFLVHGFIEAYLKEWLFISGKISKESLTSKEVDEIERLSFKNALLIQRGLGNISSKTFQKALTLNKHRNEFAHSLIKIDVQDEKSIKKIVNIVQQALKTCDDVSGEYKRALDKKQKRL